jgi:hypothetical protein
LRWGASTAERHFVLESSDIDLGDIVLQRQATLHGQIAGCQSGEAIALPVPDLSKAPVFDESRASIDADGRFFIDGLSPGQWSVLIRCQGTSIITTPQAVTVPDHGDLVIQFTRVKR